jgi:hypothetical protein
MLEILNLLTKIHSLINEYSGLSWREILIVFITFIFKFIWNKYKLKKIVKKQINQESTKEKMYNKQKAKIKYKKILEKTKQIETEIILDKRELQKEQDRQRRLLS